MAKRIHLHLLFVFRSYIVIILMQAVEDRNKIWATVRIGSNQDGCISKPMTAPSGHQQLKLLKRVYKTFQFEPADIQYIEAHGM